MPVALLLALVFATAPRPVQGQDERPRNLILFIADGAGPASFTLARDYTRAVLGGTTLHLDPLQVGSVRTYATNSRVTDSAAGATAYAAGVKTYNGAIAVDTLRRPVATLVEAAEAAGMATGLVATSRITHATPASFAAHVPQRGMEEEIAAQMLGMGLEVIMGGGRGFFLPTEAGGGRRDGRDLIAAAEELGYTVAGSREAWADHAGGPLLALFSSSHMAYEIDRDSLDEPSLAEMTARAIDLLDQDEDGFFLMVEGSRIDHAAHSNDAAAHLHDLLAYDAALAVALTYAEQQGETLVVSVADHETGGLTLGRNLNGRGVYAWNPDVLARVQASIGVMAAEVREQSTPPAEVLRRLAGIDDLTLEEEQLLAEALAQEARLDLALGAVINRRAILGWTTLGHTAVDINLYAFGPGQERFGGNMDNAEVGRVLADLLGFDLAALTRRLQRDQAPN